MGVDDVVLRLPDREVRFQRSMYGARCLNASTRMPRDHARDEDESEGVCQVCFGSGFGLGSESPCYVCGEW